MIEYTLFMPMEQRTIGFNSIFSKILFDIYTAVISHLLLVFQYDLFIVHCFVCCFIEIKSECVDRKCGMKWKRVSCFVLPVYPRKKIEYFLITVCMWSRIQTFLFLINARWSKILEELLKILAIAPACKSKRNFKTNK